MTVFLTTATAGIQETPVLSSCPRGTKVLQGVIVNVVSAGEMVLWEKGRLHPFRLYGIDLPDPDGPEGRRAKRIVSDLVFNTLLRVYLLPGDASPPRGIVMIQGTCLNQTLVRRGTARLTDTCGIPEICLSWRPPRQKAGENAGGPAPSGTD